ncbi:piggyBac transposable element-derived protein 4-like [Dermacentor albipictus]|uniref:piggyBac transposable element-derived protein 4-like n=1 Tax=Dermacentor albipictus TaxID=60249 RepID=UPI0038FC49B6
MMLRSGPKRLSRALDVFRLFFTAEVIHAICANTNKYAWMHIIEKPTYSEKDGSWKEVTPAEMMRFIALLLYMGVLELPRLHMYWSTAKLFSGLLPPNIMPRRRFTALLAMLHISDPDTSNGAAAQKLDKVSWLLEHMNDCSASLFQPYREISVDERMVKSKARSGIRQYIRDKVVKWGYKLWVLADPKTGYTIQFIVYTGKREKPSANGLAFDVVTKLCDKYLDRGYIIYMDNFYTSTSLLVHLLERKTLACGTTRKDRRGFPTELKGVTWEKRAKRGDVRWLRDKGVLYLQWKDRRVVHMVSTAHTANSHVLAKRREKKDGKWQQISIKKPQLIDEYNAGMLGVDKSDQLIATYNVLRKCVRWWKTLFFHCIDIAAVNSYIIFQEYRTQHPQASELSRPSRYDQLAFRTELIGQLLELEDTAPVHVPPSPAAQRAAAQHKPERKDVRRNCKKCYEENKIQHKTNVFCRTCNVHLCFTTRNCFGDWHTNLAD